MAAAAKTMAPAPSAQKREVEQAHKASRLKLGDRYYVLSQKWWAAWRDHVAYDDGGEGLERLRLNSDDAPAPGPIGNEPLGIRVRGELVLREGLVERDDYALVCAAVWELLEEWYGGGPAFPCRVVQGASSADLGVEVYPLRFDARRVGRDGRAADADPSEPGLVVSRCSALGQARRVLEQTVEGGFEEARVWVRAAAEEDYAGPSTAGEPRPLSEKFWGRGPDSDDEGEKEWQLLEGDDEAMLGGVPAIFACREAPRWGALVEVRARQTPGGNDEWPRDLIREKWRRRLKPGDAVDARDSEGRWFDSVVVEVEEPPGTKVKVHFKGWSSRWDSWIERDDETSLQPLFARTDDWRRLKEGDSCEIRSENADKPLWYEARVVDVAGDRVEVRTVAQGAQERQRWLEVSSEQLCRMGTHIKRSRSATLQANARDAATADRHRADPYGGYQRDPAAARHGVTHARDARPGRSHVRGRPPARGAVGLSNLGNTCFMNSMLQCLSHTRPLTAYFLADDSRDGRPRFLDEVNADNPLGAGGQIARAYADFVRDVWSGKFSVVVPTALKRSIGTHAPQFSGYQQQDSQELMNYVLDGLHEDLNRVRQKPYVETLEANGRPDDEVAKESWRRFGLRNSSIVMDVCYGQLKSHITCPKCDSESVTFDPFLSISLPLPAAKSRKVSVTLFRRSPADARPLRLRVAVGKRDGVRALKDALARLAYPNGTVCGSDIDVCDVWGHRVYRTFADDFSVEHIKPNDDVVAFEVGDRATARTVDVLLGTVMARLGPGARRPYELFGRPLRLRVEPGATCGEVRADIAKRVARFVRPAPATDESEGGGYELRVSGSSGTRYEADLPADGEPLPDAVSTLTLEWTTGEAAAAVDSDEAVAADDHASHREDEGEGRGIQLVDCFRKLVEREQLGETEQWYCSECKEHHSAFKKLDLWSLPEILVIHLMRFQYAQNTYFVHRQKLDDLVTFPLKDLDLGEFVLNPADKDRAMYDLYAVSEHSGGLGGGHYTATALDDNTGVWYHYNDSVVTRADPATIVTSQAYVLFYKRQAQR